MEGLFTPIYQGLHSPWNIVPWILNFGYIFVSHICIIDPFNTMEFKNGAFKIERTRLGNKLPRMNNLKCSPGDDNLQENGGSHRRKAISRN